MFRKRRYGLIDHLGAEWLRRLWNQGSRMYWHRTQPQTALIIPCSRACDVREVEAEVILEIPERAGVRDLSETPNFGDQSLNLDIDHAAPSEALHEPFPVPSNLNMRLCPSFHTLNEGSRAINAQLYRLCTGAQYKRSIGFSIDG